MGGLAVQVSFVPVESPVQHVSDWVDHLDAQHDASEAACAGVRIVSDNLILESDFHLDENDDLLASELGVVVRDSVAVSDGLDLHVIERGDWITDEVGGRRPSATTLENPDHSWSCVCSGSIVPETEV